MPALGKPKPFQRPGIDLDKVARHWEDNVPWGNLKVGDLVADLGVVERLMPNELGVRIEFPNASVLHRNGHTVKAFIF